MITPRGRFLSDCLLILAFALVSVHIIVISQCDYNGCLSPDSTRYFGVADNLASGLGLTQTDYSTPGGRSYFTMQPAGYPLLLFVMKKILPGISLFYISKLFNILLVGLVFLMFRFISQERAYLYAFVLFGAGLLETVTYSLSETPFLVLLTALIITLERYENGNRVHYWRAVLTGSILIGLFLLRYIGLFAAGVVITAAIIEFRKGRRDHAYALTAAAFFAFVFAALYFLNNYRLSSTFSGNHVPAPEHIGSLATGLVKALLFELNPFVSYGGSLKRTVIFLVTMTAEIAAIWWFYKRWGKHLFTSTSKKTDPDSKSVWRLCFFTACAYWLSLAMLRFFIHFDAFYFRTMAPGTFLLFIATVNLIEEKMPGEALAVFSRLWAAGFAVSFLLSSPVYLYDTVIIDRNESYATHIARFQEKYTAVPQGSLVGLADDHIRYLRPDCQPVYPLNPDYNNEDMNSFRGRILQSPASHVYIEIQPVDPYRKWHRSVEVFLAENEGKDFIKLR